MTKYKVVRSYNSRVLREEQDLKEAFEDGWEFVEASDYIPRTPTSSSGYIEYILKKEEEKNVDKDSEQTANN